MSTRNRIEADAAPHSGPVVFVQPFGVSDPGGGARILRMLLTDAPVECFSLVAAMRPPRPTACVAQRHLPLRPLGRLNRTRLRGLIQKLDPLWREWHQRMLEQTFVRLRPRAVHVVVQPGGDLAAVTRVARRHQLPLAASFHDHPDFFKDRGQSTSDNLSAAKEIWSDADCRFVISDELGEKLSADFGRRPFELVSDGVERLGCVKENAPRTEYTVYFMGLLHEFYEPNFSVLLESLELVGRKTNSRFTLRIRSNPSGRFRSTSRVRVECLPFADDATVADEIERADLLYLPLPFATAGRALAAYSLSTKMISYLASGRAIVYHGPASAAAGRLLARHRAAICVTEPNVEAMATALRLAIEDHELLRDCAAAALELARAQFQAGQIRSRFWNSLLATGSKPAAVEAPGRRPVNSAVPQAAATS